MMKQSWKYYYNAKGKVTAQLLGPGILTKNVLIFLLIKDQDLRMIKIKKVHLKGMKSTKRISSF